MWPKDAYQEQMLGYLDGMLTEIEQLERFPINQPDLVELYDDLVIALKRLWRLIEASDSDWERFRYPLEASCDKLLREFYRVSYTGYLQLSSGLNITENRNWQAQSADLQRMVF